MHACNHKPKKLGFLDASLTKKNDLFKEIYGNGFKKVWKKLGLLFWHSQIFICKNNYRDYKELIC